jgi:hypothetical protein
VMSWRLAIVCLTSGSPPALKHGHHAPKQAEKPYLAVQGDRRKRADTRSFCVAFILCLRVERHHRRTEHDEPSSSAVKGWFAKIDRRATKQSAAPRRSRRHPPDLPRPPQPRIVAAIRRISPSLTSHGQHGSTLRPARATICAEK